jgi:pSer/pThr/pTyr-binding forkhead associated (FHA) protein
VAWDLLCPLPASIDGEKSYEPESRRDLRRAKEKAMVANITLTAENGPFKGKSYVFTRNQRCLVGRSKDCDFQLPGDFEFMTVSRHHCLLDLEPPRISVLDLGSRNGTYINGLRICPYEDRHHRGAALDAPFAQYELADGDELKLADMAFTVHVDVPSTRPAEETHPAKEHAEFADCGEIDDEPVGEDPLAFVGCAHASR